VSDTLCSDQTAWLRSGRFSKNQQQNLTENSTMPTNRREGEIQPGIKWGPFVLRIPFIHTRFALPEMLQGICVAGATGLALVPIMVASF
jgi:hypothetical protein